jgi:cellulose synthase/poly-beta-1,6-N-acetylglucosamine synthase-like glycosyltransferase
MLGLNKKLLQQIPPTNGTSMQGAGVIADGRTYITHTTLSDENTAFINVTSKQKIFLVALMLIILFRIITAPLGTIVTLLGILSAIYFFDVVFHLYLIVKSLGSQSDIKFDQEDISALGDYQLPIYTILCPLYKEAKVIPKFVNALEKLDWPKDKLDVIILLEEDDRETLDAISMENVPGYIRTVVVPHSEPKTKPKACNYGLSLARGQYIVIYDAEDEPEPLQLKKAYLGFQKVSEDVICLQAKLNYYNSNQNLLTTLFTAEYSLWFDVILPGLELLETAIPLGGTSNHFKKADLIALEGWDAFNVTEDADLGVRLFKAGYKTAIIDSTTFEEANSQLGNWLRQRSRWIKGYIQTYFVNMRNPAIFFNKFGTHALIFQLLIGGKIAFCFINPILWIMTVSYFTLYSLLGPAIEAIYPAYIFYIALVSLIFGNFMFFYVYMIGCAKKSQWSIIRNLFFVPFYWLLISVAAFIALYQFIVKPHYWEKTIHGLDTQFAKVPKPKWRLLW